MQKRSAVPGVGGGGGRDVTEFDAPLLNPHAGVICICEAHHMRHISGPHEKHDMLLSYLQSSDPCFCCGLRVVDGKLTLSTAGCKASDMIIDTAIIF